MNSKEAKKQLRKAEKEYYCALFKQAPLGFIIVDLETTAILDFNDAAHYRLGYSRTDFSKLELSQIECKETRNYERPNVARILNDEATEYETKYRTKNGEVRNVLVTEQTIESYGKKFLVNIFHDVTDIRELIDNIKRSELQYRQLAENAMEGVWMLDAECKTTFVNTRLAQILGYDKSEIIGKNLLEFIDQSDVEIIKYFLQENTRPLIGLYKHEFPRKDQSRVFVNIAISQINDEAGQLIGYFALISDITEFKKIENQLRAYSKNLELMIKQATKKLDETQAQLVKAERFASIGELAGMVGHDLRNPLTAIKNAVYVLRKKDSLSLDNKSNEMLTIIDKSVEHASKILTDLLEFSREIKLDVEECSPKSLVDYAILSVKTSKGVKISDHTQSFPMIWIDINKIERVFINIINNAIEAMPDGGTLKICSQQNGNNLDFVFSDTGMGLSGEAIEKLFTPLFTTKSNGIGFGLAICKKIVEAHHGRISVESMPNKGTTFIISLPMEQDVNNEIIRTEVAEFPVVDNDIQY